MIKKIVNVAVIGAGYMADLHIQTFSALENVNVLAIANRSKSKAEALALKYNIANVYNDHVEMLDRESCDLVIVAVSETVVKTVLCEVAAYGMPIFSEKPIGLNLRESEEVASEIASNNVRFWAGLNRRAYSSTQTAVEGLKNDTNQRFIHVSDQQDQKAVLEAGFNPLIVENWSYANSIHLIDYLCLFGRGDITEVQVLDPWRPEKDSCLVAARIGFSSGDVGLYTAVWGMPGPWSCSVTTAEKRWEMRPLETITVQAHGSRQVQDCEIDKIDTEYKAGLYRQAEDVIDAVVTGADARIVPDMNEVIRVTRLVSEIYNMQ